MESIAVYWEPTIKTYGFLVKTGLSLLNIALAPNRVVDWGERIQQIGTVGSGFLMAAGRLVDGKVLQLQLLFEKDTAGRYRFGLEKSADADSSTLSVNEPVELIYFHGPHFGDRYGIADAAFGTLAPNKIEVLAAACTGTSIYIVVPANNARLAVELLSKRFDAPLPEKSQL